MTFSPCPPDSLSSGDKLSLTQEINNARHEITKSRVIADQQATKCGSGMQHVADVYHLPCESIIPGTCSSSMRCIIGCKDAKPQMPEPTMS